MFSKLNAYLDLYRYQAHKGVHTYSPCRTEGCNKASRGGAACYRCVLVEMQEALAKAEKQRCWVIRREDGLYRSEYGFSPDLAQARRYKTLKGAQGQCRESSWEPVELLMAVEESL